jgi:creatinine amidohydrolase
MGVSGRRFFWGDLTSEEFRGLDPERCVVVLPVAAVEQHGPHLPVLTDTAIADGMLGMLREMLPDELDVLVLPTQAYGKSNEHLLSPGTLTLSAQALLEVLTEIGASVARAGLRKIVLVNSHGGNTEVLGIVTRELRVRHAMLCVATHWHRFGLPPGLYGTIEDRHGIHAGDIETSLMLHFRPELVRMHEAKTFVSNAVAIEQEFTHLRPTGPHSFGWIAQDLNAEGAVGDATMATAEKGKQTAEHQVDGFIALLRDMTAFPLNRLFAADADPLI